jgi:hypothetical protein
MKGEQIVEEEVSNFIGFLDRLLSFSLPVSRKEEVFLTCENANVYKDGAIDLAIVFVGDPKVIENTHFGYEPYVDYIKRTAKRGISTFYLLARGKINVLIADAVAKIIENENLLKITDRYDDKVRLDEKTIETLCIRLQKT